MSNNGFKAISENLIIDIQEGSVTRGEFGTFMYLMLKANYVTHKALGSFSSIAEDLKTDVRQISRDCYNLRDYGWIDFEVKQGQRKPIVFNILTGWWDNEQTTQARHGNNSQVSPKSVLSQSQHGNNSQVSPKSVLSQSQVSPKSSAPPDASGLDPVPVSADVVSADNTEHEERNMEQQRSLGKKEDVESQEEDIDKDVVVSNFCFEENSADFHQQENQYVGELCELFANAYGETLSIHKSREWILSYGINRCKEIITKGNPAPDNPIGYMQKALVDNWQFKGHNAKQFSDKATPSVEATKTLIDNLKAMWSENQNPTAEEIAKVDSMLINAGLKDPAPKADEQV